MPLLLTFDDHHPAEWAAARPLFDAHGARATFFVSHTDRLDDAGRRHLGALAADGHAIGCHTHRHLRAPQLLAEHGAADYLAREIEPCTAALHAAGLAPRAFAYPYNDRTAATDTVLAERFTRLRAGAGADGRDGRPLPDTAFVSASDLPDTLVLPGIGIDTGRGPDVNPDNLPALEDAFRRAADDGSALTLYAHRIADSHPRANHLAPARLAHLLALAARLRLPCITVDELPGRAS